jgi:crotonobetainyl-CoA:carnitine CoA-transferase CaiB-like acyl-CoA transferase
VTNVLDGVPVVQMTEALAGPCCAMLLGDLGADVVKVQRPGIGDQSRGWGPAPIHGVGAALEDIQTQARRLIVQLERP